VCVQVVYDVSHNMYLCVYVCGVHVCVWCACMCVVCMYVCGVHVCVWCACVCVVCMYVCGVHVCVWCACMCVRYRATVDIVHSILSSHGTYRLTASKSRRMRSS